MKKTGKGIKKSRKKSGRKQKYARKRNEVPRDRGYHWNSICRETVPSSQINMRNSQHEISLSEEQGRESLDNKREIKEGWKQHYEKLYNEGNPVDDTVLDELPAFNGHEQMLDIMGKEVEVAIKNLKRRKAPGEDNITAEMIQAPEEDNITAETIQAPGEDNITAKMIQAGENCSVEMLHRLCNQIYCRIG